VDQGTAFCFGQFQEETGEALLLARAERDFNDVILRTVIRSNDVYQRQQGAFPFPFIYRISSSPYFFGSQPFSLYNVLMSVYVLLDTLIVWTEPDGVDYALSFQDPEGCSEVWNFITEVQQHMNSLGACHRLYAFNSRLKTIT
jgi:protein phosphatase-4 regulatory subunit 3